MGLYDRDYYRESSSRGPSVFRGSSASANVVKYLIALNVVVFLMQILIVRPMTVKEFLRNVHPDLEKQIANGDKNLNEELQLEAMDALRNSFMPQTSPVTEWLKLDTKKVIYSGQVWRLFTSGFCHDRHQIWHILVNMVVLYWFGSTVEMMYGSREFLLFYMTGLLVASLAFIGLDLFLDRPGSAVGASGAVFAVSMLYTMNFPRSIIYFFFVIPVEMRWAMALYVLWDLHPVLLALSGDRLYTGVAHAAHLGGVAFGYLYFKNQWRLEDLFDRVKRPECLRKRRPAARPRLRLAPETIPEPEPTRAVDGDRLDQILTKISRTGQASLTDEEVAILKRASEDLKNRRQKGEF